jgi:hypothetical protein
MNQRLRSALWIFALLVSGWLLLHGLFEDLMRHPNRYIYGNGEDSYKNYFTAAYYLKYDSGLHFSGMNYPYGEHILYTDNQPLLSGLLKLSRHLGFAAEAQVVGVFNFLMLYGLLLAAALMYLTGRRLLLPHWAAAALGLLSAFLSPQIHRITGHYALGYAFYIPLLWLLLLRSERRPLRSLWPQPLLILAAGFVHPYYLMIGGMFAGAFWGVKALELRKDRPAALGAALRILLTAGLPIACFLLFMKLSDPVADRPSTPYGFLTYRAYLSTIFLPVADPLYQVWHRFFQTPPRDMEGFSYIGLAAGLACLLGLLRAARFVLRGAWRRALHPALPSGLGASLAAATLMLLFSLGVPFIWGLEFLTDYLGPLRQFRSLGRFAWPFYYVISAYAAVYGLLLFRRLRQRGLLSFAWGILALAACIWLAEGLIHLQNHAHSIRRNSPGNPMRSPQPDYAAMLAEKGYQFADFQALLPLPAFHIGSDKYNSRFVNPGITGEAFRIAYRYGLPLICGSMSRTSVSQSSKLVQLLSDEQIEKEILADLPDGRPLLVLKQNQHPLTWEQQLLLRRLALIREDSLFSLYRLDLSLLRSSAPAAFARFDSLRPALLAQGALLSARSEALLAYEGFDPPGGDSAFGASTRIQAQGPLLLYEGAAGLSSERLHVSAWVRAFPEETSFPYIQIEEYGPEGGLLASETFASMWGAQVYRGEWLLAECLYRARAPENRLRITLEGRRIEAESFLLRPESSEVYLPFRQGRALMHNNFYLERP